MKCLERAFRYFIRKKSKTILLLLLFLVANTTILGAFFVLSASDEINQQIREKTNTKVIVEASDREKLLTQKDAELIQEADHISSINRVAQNAAYPNSFYSISGSEEKEDGKVMVLGYDDMEKDSPFENNVCRLIEGDYAIDDNEIVLNQNLADSNGLSVGDEIELINTEGNTVSAVISGLYLTGNERQQTELVAAVNRIENQVYTTIQFLFRINDDLEFRKIAAYVDDPEQLEQTAEKLNSLLMEKAQIGMIDTVYQKMKFTIIQIERIGGLIFLLTLVTSAAVIAMLLCMWIRNRKAEIAVYISLGISKIEVFLQMLFEVWMTYVISAILSSVFIRIMTPILRSILNKAQNVNLPLTFSVKSAAVIFSAGMMLLILLVALAMLPCFGKKINDTLSEMEG